MRRGSLTRQALCLLLAVLFLLPLPAGAQPGGIGDLNGDGKLTVSDVVLLRQALLREGAAAPVSDLNRDNSLTVADVTLLRGAALRGDFPAPLPGAAAHCADALRAAIESDFFPSGPIPLEKLEGSDPAWLWSYTAWLDALAAALEAHPADADLAAEYTAALDTLSAWRVTTGEGRTAYAPGVGGEGDLYYDDNSLVVLAYCRGARLLGNPGYLREAEEVAAFVRTGWNETLGGLWWNTNHEASPFSATCATASAAYAHSMLYTLTGREEYLTWATRLYQWVKTSVRDGATGLYGNQLNLDGTRDMTLWTYNSGYMLSVAACLYAATGDAAYQTDAAALAAAADGYFGRVGEDGVYRLGTAEPWFHLVLWEGYENYSRLSPGGAAGCLRHLESAVLYGAAHPKEGSVYVNRTWQEIPSARDTETTLLDQCGTLAALYRSEQGLGIGD